MVISERHIMIVEELKKEFPKAHAVDPDDVRVIYVITDDPDKYAEHVGA